MSPEDVARFLQENPSFFEDYAEVLAKIQVPHPQAGQPISLVDRQLLGLREKYRALEGKLTELLQFGVENDTISEKMHRLSAALLATASRAALLAVLHASLREDFSIPHVALRLWGLPPRELDAGRDEYADTSNALKTYAASLTQPYCGANSNAEAAAWFGDAEQSVQSVAHIPLREMAPAADGGACVGLLVLGSDDAARFFADMGTLYLKRLADLAGAGLSRFA